MSLFTDEQLRMLIKEKNLKTASDVQKMLKEMFGKTLEAMLQAELETELGYSKHDYKNKTTENSRNGYSTKKVTTKLGEVDINVPRDRNNEFTPIAVKKNQKDVSSIQDQIISMYAKGMSVRDIQDHLDNIYGIEASPTLISNITGKIMPLVKEWQNRPLQEVYSVLFLDAIHYKVREECQIINKAAYVILGIDLEGRKEILGIWIGKSESAKFWLSVLNELKNRGVKDVLITCVDNLSGFSEAIEASFPKTDIQKCIIHQIRNSMKYISYRDVKAFVADLKPIYKAVNEEEALAKLAILEERWGEKYPLAIKSWKANWHELSTFFKYPDQIRKIIYTTNIIESFHRQLRKTTKPKNIFPSDDALMKILYLTTMDVERKLTSRIHDWGSILSQFLIYFEERIGTYVL